MSVIIRKLFFAWGEEKEKVFLEDMAKKGYKLISVGFGRYEFEPMAPKEVCYEFDFKGLKQTDIPEYLQIYQDAGWENIAIYGGWYYFYKEKGDEDIDISIFNDNASKREKYKRLIIFLLITGLPLYYQMLIFFPLILSKTGGHFGSFYYSLVIIGSLIAILHFFALIMILRMYLKLLKEIKE